MISMGVFDNLELRFPLPWGTFSQFPSPLWLWGKDRRLLDCNRSAAVLLQEDSATLRGRLPRDLCLQIPPWGDVWLGKSGLPTHAELRLPGKPSLAFWARHYPVLDPQGETVAALTLFDDLGPRIAAAEFQFLLEHTPTGVLALTADDLVTICNPAAARLLGLDAAMLLGQPWRRVLAENRFSPNAWPKSSDSPQPIVWPHPTGEVPLTVHGHLVHDPLEKPVHVFYLISPADDAFTLHQEQSAAATIHEIRNPLTVIEGFIQLFEPRFPPQEKHSIQLVLSELARINRMLEDLLAFHPSPYEAPYCDVTPLLEQCVSLYRPQALQDGVEFELQLAADLPPVAIGQGPLLQIVHNLLQNALQAISGRGRILLRGLSSPLEVVLEVQDTGTGIPPWVTPCIFEPFYTTKENGTGLGLSICQRLLADAGGQIRLVESGPAGTIFALHLPRANTLSTPRT